MTQLAPLTLDDGTVIYMEVTSNVDDIPSDTDSHSGETTRTAKGASEQVVRSFQAMQGTIRAYTSYTLNAFRQMAGAVPLVT